MVDFLGVEHISSLEIVNSLFGIGPIGVLGEDSPDHNLEGGVARPPVLGTKMVQQSVIEGHQIIFK